MFAIPHIPYRTDRVGYWLPVTSTLNWCEEDYYATIYSAEIVNTLTNLLFMYLAFKGLLNCRKHGHDTIFSVAFVGYFLFPATWLLWYRTLLPVTMLGDLSDGPLPDPMQLVDELSMIYTTCLMCYATFSYKRSTRFRISLAASQIFLSLFITLYYHYLQDPAFHQAAYALLTAVVVFRSMYVMVVALRPPNGEQRLEPGAGTEPASTSSARAIGNERNYKRDAEILKNMWILVALGLSTFLGGFVIWTIDNECCSSLRKLRHQIGLPWGLVLEFHGWWHIMTGTGAYFYLVWAVWLRHCLNGRQDEYRLNWPRLSLPEIVKVEPSNGTSDKRSPSNGSAKKRL